MPKDCPLCAIARDGTDPSIVAMDELTMTLVHRGQWRYAHFLVIPRQHTADIRDMDEATTEALMLAVARAAQAIDRESPGERICIWKPGCHGSDERHAYVHVHPRRLARPPAPRRETQGDDDTADASASRWRTWLASTSSTAGHRLPLQLQAIDPPESGDKPASATCGDADRPLDTG